MVALYLGLAVAALAGAGFIGYSYGSKISAKALQALADERSAALNMIAFVHKAISKKLSAAKTELSKIEAEGKAEEKAVVVRLKNVL